MEREKYCSLYKYCRESLINIPADNEGCSKSPCASQAANRDYLSHYSKSQTVGASTALRSGPVLPVTSRPEHYLMEKTYFRGQKKERQCQNKCVVDDQPGAALQHSDSSQSKEAPGQRQNEGLCHLTGGPEDSSTACYITLKRLTKSH